MKVVSIKFLCFIDAVAVISCLTLTLPLRGLSRRRRTHFVHNARPHDDGGGDLYKNNVSDPYRPPFGFYVHIPYCRRRCRYCDFAIVPIGLQTNAEDSNEGLHRNSGFREMDLLYRNALLKEIQGIKHCEVLNDHSDTGSSSRASDSAKREGKRIELQSIYFGGGTPSLAPIETIESILRAIIASSDVEGEKTPFYLAKDAEITIEMDPGTFTLSKLERLRDLGINRISLGVQSFDDVSLARIGRTHRLVDVLEAIEIIHQVFGSDANYSIDIISGLPALTLAKWIETLQFATSLRPRPCHISIYDLQVERGTVFGRWYKENSQTMTETTPSSSGRNNPGFRHDESAHPPLPSADDCAFMYKFAAGYLRSKNYEHYEVSSYARNGNPSRRSRHNQVYWSTNGQWYAIGLGSTSSVRGQQIVRPRAFADYIRWVEEQNSSQWMQVTDGIQGAHPEDSLERLSDIVMKRLRTSDGLDLNWVQENIGYDAVRSILKGASLGLDLGLAEIVPKEFEATHTTTSVERTLRLVDPGGLLYSNYIISEIFMELGVADDEV